jgi:hypothetical protein
MKNIKKELSRVWLDLERKGLFDLPLIKFTSMSAVIEVNCNIPQLLTKLTRMKRLLIDLGIALSASAYLKGARKNHFVSCHGGMAVGHLEN